MSSSGMDGDISGLPVIGARLRPEGYASGNVMRARSLIDEPTSSVEKRKTKGLFDGPRQKPQQREQSILLISKWIIWFHLHFTKIIKTHKKCSSFYYECMASAASLRMTNRRRRCLCHHRSPRSLRLDHHHQWLQAVVEPSTARGATGSPYERFKTRRCSRTKRCFKEKRTEEMGAYIIVLL